MWTLPLLFIYIVSVATGRDDQTFSYNFFCVHGKIPTSHPGPEAAIITPSTPCFSNRMTFLMCKSICFMPDACHSKRPLVTHLSFECYFKRLGKHLRNKHWCFSWLPMVSVLLLSHKPHFGPSFFFFLNVVSWPLTSARATETCSSLALPFGIFWMSCYCVPTTNFSSYVCPLFGDNGSHCVLLESQNVKIAL